MNVYCVTVVMRMWYVRQDLEREYGLCVSLRTVERAAAPFRQQQAALSQATIRYESPPGKQLQIDLGEKRVSIAGEMQKVFVFVSTLGYCRRSFALAFSHHRQTVWFEGLAATFRHFGGVPEEVLMDNESALVKQARTARRAVLFQDRLLAFAPYWGFTPKACIVYRAQTKGKDENAVKFAKQNALAGHRFSRLADLNAHLQRWLREVADQRIHGTTKQKPLWVFAEEAPYLAPIDGRPPFVAGTEVLRRVSKDCVVQFESNSYSVPWQLVGQQVRVEVAKETLRIYHGAELKATHAVCAGRHPRCVLSEHFEGLQRPAEHPEPPSTLSRSLDEYAQLAGENF